MAAARPAPAPGRPALWPCGRRPAGGAKRPATLLPTTPTPSLANARPGPPPPAPAVPTDAATAAPSFLSTPPAPTLRCALCYELGFTTRAALADHLVGPAHTRHWGPLLVRAGRAARAAGAGRDAAAAAAAAATAVGVACPYCGAPAPAAGPDAPASCHPMRWLRRHVSGGDCGRGRTGSGDDENAATTARRPDPVACFEPPPPEGAPPWVDLRDGAAFPRYAPLLSRPVPPDLAAGLGVAAAPPAATLTIRPLHPSRAHALAVVLTAAFADDPDPPTYAWLARELAREAARFEGEAAGGGEDESGVLALGSGRLALPPRPLPSDTCSTAGGAGGGAPRWWRVGRGRVEAAAGEGGYGTPATAPPGRAGARPPATGAGGGAARRAESEEEDDEWRVRMEEAWGRWLWLVAEVEAPRDVHDVRPRVLGGAALLLHDRAPALAALRGLDPPGSPSSLDFALWLTSDPSPAATAGCGGRGAWLWWAGVDGRARRAGVGASLVAAAEVAAAGLGLEALYVQALAPPPASPDVGGLGLLAGLWGGGGGQGGNGRQRRPDPGAAARALYARAGYTPLPPPAGGSTAALAAPWWGGGGRPRPAVDASAVMLGKWLGPPGEGGGAWWEEEV